MSNIQGNEPASTEKSQAEKDDDEYWSDCDAKTSDFQHNQLLHIVSHSSVLTDPLGLYQFDIFYKFISKKKYL